MNRTYFYIGGAVLIVSGLVYWLFFSKSSPGRAKNYPKITNGWSSRKYEWFKDKIIENYTGWVKGRALEDNFEGIPETAAFYLMFERMPENKKERQRKLNQSEFEQTKNEASQKEWKDAVEKAAKRNAKWAWRTGNIPSHWFEGNIEGEWRQYANNNGLTIDGYKAE